MNYDITKSLEISGHDIKKMYEKLKNISILTGNEGKLFEELLTRYSNSIEKGFDSSYFEWINYNEALLNVFEGLYPEGFGFDISDLWDFSEPGKNQVCEFDEFLNLCYAYITTYLVSKTEFLDDFARRLEKRNARFKEKLENMRERLVKKYGIADNNQELNIDLIKKLGVNNIDELYNKLNEDSALTENESLFFENQIEENGLPLDYKFGYDYRRDDAFIEMFDSMYGTGFGFNILDLYDCELEGNVTEFLNLCYKYIITYITDEKTFMQDYIRKLEKRDDRVVYALESERNSFLQESEQMKAETKFSNNVKIIELESLNPEDYPNLKLRFKVFDSEKLAAYVNLLPSSNYVFGIDESDYEADVGMSNEIVDLSQKVYYKGNIYRLSQKQTQIEKYNDDEIENAQIVVTRKNDILGNKQVYDSSDFLKYFELNYDTDYFNSTEEEKVFIRIDDDIVCDGVIILAGSYISLDGNSKIEQVVNGKTFELYYGINTISNKRK